LFNFNINIIILSVTVFSVTFLLSILLTLRTIFLIKGLKILATIIIFFETVTGLIVGITIISQAIKNGSNFFIILFYGLGYASGLFLGININQKLSKSLISINIITKKSDNLMEDLLRKNGFGVTCYSGSGKDGNVKVLNIVCKNTDLVKVNKIVINNDKEAMITRHLIEGLNGGFVFNTKGRLF
jgi:uncharacterized protein YebE (UPF0316 family)